MLQPANFSEGDIIAMDRAYISYEKFEELTQRGVIYVTKMKKNLVYTVSKDVICQSPEGVVLVREQYVTFTKHKTKEREEIKHQARIITYIDHKGRPISLLTNDMELPCEEIIEIYHRRWQIELLFKQIKQNFPLKYFYGESANAIKLQIWVTLIANYCCPIKVRKGIPRGLNRRIEAVGLSIFDFQAPLLSKTPSSTPNLTGFSRVPFYKQCPSMSKSAVR